MSKLRINLGKLASTAIRRVIFDADYLTYSIGFAVEDETIYPDDTTERVGDLPLARTLIDNRVRYFRNSCPPQIRFDMALSGDGDNWRKKLVPSYKVGRGRKPIDYEGIRKHLKEMDRMYVTSDGLEADDYMAAEASNDPDGTALMSFDKDFFTVMGTFIHLSQTGASRMYRIEPGMALCFLFFQAIVGDAVDSYKGVPNVGRNKASHILQLCELKGLTIRQVFLLLKQTFKAREKKYGIPVWKPFRDCLDLAALTWYGEEPKLGIGLRRVFKYRKEALVYFLPYYDPECTYKFTKMRL